MKNTISIKWLVLLAGMYSSSLLAADVAPASGADKASQASAEGLKKDLSYFFGFSFGNMLKEGGNVDVDMPPAEPGYG
jgi:hypothetical protein